MTATSKILIVEDVELNRELLTQMLESEYEVCSASDGLMGVEITRRERPDLILMDLALPLMDGWEATRLIKSDPGLRHIPIIAVTACAMPGDEQNARAAGCEDYVTKPIRRSELLAKVRRVLESVAEA